MPIYCVKCHKKTPDVNPHEKVAANGRPMIQAKCKVCGTTKTQFISGKSRAGSKSSKKAKTGGKVKKTTTKRKTTKRKAAPKKKTGGKVKRGSKSKTTKRKTGKRGRGFLDDVGSVVKTIAPLATMFI